VSAPVPDFIRIRRGYAVALASAAILSTTAIFIRHLTLTYGLPALVLAFWRDFFAVLTVWFWLGTRHPERLRLKRDQLLFFAGFGLVLALFNAFWTLSVAWNGAAVATVLAYSSTAFTVLLARLLLNESLNKVKLLVVAVCLGGCALVSGGWRASAWHVNGPGIAAGLLSGLFYAAYSLLGRTAARRGFDPWAALLYAFSFATLFLLAVNLLPGGVVTGAAARPVDLFWLGNSLSGWGTLFLLAAGPTVAGFGLYIVSLGYLPSGVVNLIVTSETVFTALTAWLLLGEKLGLAQLGGGLLILSGVGLLRLRERFSSAS
jgi:drug/metabolite transporter (DMT)-like permease